MAIFDWALGQGSSANWNSKGCWFDEGEDITGKHFSGIGVRIPGLDQNGVAIPNTTDEINVAGNETIKNVNNTIAAIHVFEPPSPHSGSVASVEFDGTLTVKSTITFQNSFAGMRVNGSITLSGATATMDILQIGGPPLAFAQKSLTVDDGGSFNMIGGTVNAGTLKVLGGTAQLSVSGGGTLNVNGPAIVKQTGGEPWITFDKGTLSVNNNDLSLDGRLKFIHASEGSVATATISSHATGSLQVGDYDDVSDPSKFMATNMYVGDAQGGSGYVIAAPHGQIFVSQFLYLSESVTDTQTFSGEVTTEGGFIEIGGRTLLGDTSHKHDDSIVIDSLFAGLIGHGYVNTNTVVNNGLLQADGGLLLVRGDITGAGFALIANGASLEIGGSVSQDTTIGFIDAAGSPVNQTLVLDLPANFAGKIVNLQAGDTIELVNVVVFTNQVVFAIKDGHQVLDIQGTDSNGHAVHFYYSVEGLEDLSADHVSATIVGKNSFLTVAAPTTYSWIGGDPGAFGTAANWVDKANPAKHLVPGSSDTAEIASGTAVLSGGSADPGAIHAIGDGAFNVEAGGNLTVHGAVTVAQGSGASFNLVEGLGSNLNIVGSDNQSGDLTLDGRLFINQGAGASAASVTISSSSVASLHVGGNSDSVGSSFLAKSVTVGGSGGSGFLVADPHGAIYVNTSVTLLTSTSAGLFVSETGSVEIGGHSGATEGTVEIDPTGVLIGHGEVVAPTIHDMGVIEAQGGTLKLVGDVTGSGVAKIDANSALEVTGKFAFGNSDFAHVAFAGANGSLVLDQAANFRGYVTGLQLGDTIVLKNTSATNLSANFITDSNDSHHLVVFNGSGSPLANFQVFLGDIGYNNASTVRFATSQSGADTVLTLTTHGPTTTYWLDSAGRAVVEEIWGDGVTGYGSTVVYRAPDNSVVDSTAYKGKASDFVAYDFTGYQYRSYEHDFINEGGMVGRLIETFTKPRGALAPVDLQHVIDPANSTLKHDALKVFRHDTSVVLEYHDGFGNVFNPTIVKGRVEDYAATVPDASASLNSAGSEASPAAAYDFAAAVLSASTSSSIADGEAAPAATSNDIPVIPISSTDQEFNLDGTLKKLRVAYTEGSSFTVWETDPQNRLYSVNVTSKDFQQIQANNVMTSEVLHDIQLLAPVLFAPGAALATIAPEQSAHHLQQNLGALAFDATGRVTTGGAGLIGHDGASLLAPDGATLIGSDGAGVTAKAVDGIVAHDGGTIIAAGGGNLVAQGGGNLVAQGGGNLVAQGGGNLVAQGGGNIVSAGAGNAIKKDGMVSASYIANAVVFTDTNEDGLLDNGEAWTIADESGHFSLDGGSGPLVATGGTDTSTHLPFKGTLSAPLGSADISSLTTLIQGLSLTTGTIDGAIVQVQKALGINEKTDVTIIDPVAGTLKGDATSSKVYVEMVKVLNTVDLIGAALAGKGADGAAAAQQVFASMVDIIANNPTLNLSNKATDVALISSVASKLGIDVSGISDAVAGIVASTSQLIDAQLAAQGSGAGLVNSVSMIETGVQSALASSLEASAGDLSKIGPAALMIEATVDNGASTLTTGRVVTLKLTASEAVTVTGAPGLQLNDGGVASYVSGTGTTTLVFKYTVQPGDSTSDLRVTGLKTAAGSTIQDGTSNTLLVSETDLGIGVDATAVTSISATSASRPEGNSGTTAFTFTLSIGGDTSVAHTVAYAVAGSGANPAAAGDFAGGTLPAGTVTFAPGETTKTLSINVTGDTAIESNEGFTVTLSNPSTGLTVGTAQASGTIQNDDSATVSIATASASKAEGNGGATDFTFTVTLSAASVLSGTVSYTVAGSGANAASGADFAGGVLPGGTVTFAPGETNKTITLGIAGDIAVETDEGFTVTLSSPSADLVLGTASAAGTIVNDDAAVSLAALAAVKAEGNSGTTAFTFTATLTGDTTVGHTVSYGVTGTGGNPASATDFAGGALPAGTVSFAPGETSKTVTVLVTGDTTVEPDEGFIVTLSGPSSGLTIGTASASGTVLNDDKAATVTAHDDAYIVLQGQSLAIGAASGLLANDLNASTTSLASNATHGTLQLSANGGFTYAPSASFTGIDEFTYHSANTGSSADGHGLLYVVPVSTGATTTLNLLALTAQEQIAATYVAFFGRAADSLGLGFWVGQFQTGLPIQGAAALFANIASSFGVSAEAKGLYPFLANPFGASDGQISAFLDSVYLNLFNRPSDPAGLTYWTGQTKQTLAAGQFVGSILVNIMGGAQNTADGQDITTLMGKVAVSLDYVHQQELHGTVWAGASDVAAATSLLHAVTSDPLSVLTGIKNADNLILNHA